MSFQEKNITVTLINFSLILCFYLFRLFQLIQGDGFNSKSIFWLWGIVIALAIVVTILATILTHKISIFIRVRKSGDKNLEDECMKDERDQLIDLKGFKLTYSIFSIGVFLSMLIYAFGQPALIMFSLIVFFGIAGQICGDAFRLLLYRKGI